MMDLDTTSPASIQGSQPQVTRLTGLETSAVAVFELSGRQTLEVAARYLQLRNAKPLWESSENQICFGFWNHAALSVSALDETSLEEVVYCRKGRDLAELHTHGSPAVAHSIRLAFQHAGIEYLETEPNDAEALPRERLLEYLNPEWCSGHDGDSENQWWNKTVRLVAHWYADPSKCQTPLHAVEATLLRFQAQALNHLGHVRANRTGELLWAQVQGALLCELRNIAVAYQSAAADGERRLSDLLATYQWGRFLSREIQVLIVGPPNVGKSSLINAMVGFERAIVSATPGTTRDLVGQNTSLFGWQFRLIDSAGLRQTTDSLEMSGIELVKQAMTEADIILNLTSVDQCRGSLRRSETATSSDFPLDIAPQAKWIAVVNKVDLLEEPASNLADIDTATSQPINSTHWVSSKTGQGLPELMKSMALSVIPESMLVGQPHDGTPPGIVFCQEIVDWLQVMISGGSTTRSDHQEC